MPWGRGILAVVATLLVVGGMVSLLVTGLVGWRPNFVNAISAEDAAALSAPYDDLRAGRDADFLARTAPQIRGDDAQAEIDALQTLLPPGEPNEVRLTTWNAMFSTNGNQLSAVHEYDYPDHVVRVQTLLSRATDEEPWQVMAFNIHVVEHADLAGAQFRFDAASPAVQAVIVAAVIVPLFVLVTFLMALFENGLRRRWLWLLAIAFAVGSFSINTAADGVTFQPFMVQVFGAGAFWSGSSLDGWLVAVGIPLGAIWYWARRLARRRDGEAEAGEA